MSSEGPPHLRSVPSHGDPSSAAAPSEQSPEQAPGAPPGVTAPTRQGGSGRALADVLIERSLVDAATVAEAIEKGRATGQRPEEVLQAAGALDADKLSRAIAERHGLHHLDLTVFPVDAGAVNMIDGALARRYSAVPVAFVDERTIVVALADPSNVLAVDDIALMTGLEVRPAVASPEDIASVIARMRRLDEAVQEAVDEDDEEQGGAEVVDLRESAQDAPVIKLVHTIIAQAADQGASDVHLEAGPREMRVRFRIDGVLSSTTTVPRRMVSGVVSRVKIMADLDIAERRIPQDGRFGLRVEGRAVDIRVVTLPSVHGESVVMRILDKEAMGKSLDQLGMNADDRTRFEHGLGRSHGTILVTGPTGSGKSTTLYAALGVIATDDRNTITIEDPVEYEIEGMTQIQVNPRAGLTFANGLRSMMRADPDIIMVGEIRDTETAQIAIESALTGHLVLSTLHTNDAPSSVARLLEMGIEPFLVASALDVVVAQRLARTLCPNCRRPTRISADTLATHGFALGRDLDAFEPGGCSRCGTTGYRGRVGLYEIMYVTDAIRKLILDRRSADEIAAVAVREGMRRLRQDGLLKVGQGRTSITEVARVTGVG